jgi:hypothetical protein
MLVRFFKVSSNDPLIIPLKATYLDQFANGAKCDESEPTASLAMSNWVSRRRAWPVNLTSRLPASQSSSSGLG